MENDYAVSYFKDDHNRTLRAKVHKATGRVEVHMIDEKRNYWVPLDKGDEPTRRPHADALSFLGEMRKKVSECPGYVW